jgi:hypothetical protein
MAEANELNITASGPASVELPPWRISYNRPIGSEVLGGGGGGAVKGDIISLLIRYAIAIRI